MRNAALFIASQNTSNAGGVLRDLLESVRGLGKSLRSRRQVAVLADFDDHLLADIGLTRRDVGEALELPFSFDPGLELQMRARRRHRRGWNA